VSADGDDVESVDLGDLGDLGDGEMRCFEDVGRYGIVVCRVAGQLHALEDNCSHADTPLSEGRFRGTKITCPLHGAQFDVTNGSHSGPPAWEGVAHYDVTETETGVTVRLENTTVDERDDLGGGGMVRTR
jgi:3-phenylpropionate/trans-cinnamate dioxygenase ferredoxin subunit